MVTKTNSRGIQNGKELVQLAFKSTDSKPTTGIMNGSTGIEVNTGKKYVFDEESGEWTEIASSGGGGGGGGSSNTKKTVTGTLADPFGDIDLADLCAKLQTMDATAYLTIDATALGAGTINSRMGANNTTDIFANGANLSNVVNLSSAYGLQWDVSDGSLTVARMLSNGNIVDISSYANSLTTSLTVVYHPISE